MVVTTKAFPYMLLAAVTNNRSNLKGAPDLKQFEKGPLKQEIAHLDVYMCTESATKIRASLYTHPPLIHPHLGNAYL